MKRCLTLLIVGSLLVMLLGAGASAAKPTIIVASKNFTEQVILGSIMKILLEENGFRVDDKLDLGGTSICRKALETGQIDVYMEYTGTALVVFHKHKEVVTDPELAYKLVSETDKKKGLIWLNKAEFNNTYTLMMRREDAEAKGIKTISDLAKYVTEHPEKISFATDAEFVARPDGFPALEKHYGFKFPRNKIIKMDPGLVYQAIKEKKVNVSMGFATDGRIEGFGLVNLIDDKQFFPVYNPAPVVRREVLDKYPEVGELLNKIGPLLDTKTMTRMNYLVDIEHKDASAVARDWLVSVGLIDK